MNATDGPLSLRAIRRYVLELAAGLGHPDSGVDLELVFFTHRLLRVRRFLRALPPETRYRAHYVPMPRRWCYQRFAVPRATIARLTRHVDIYHETTTDNPFIDSVPVLTTVHGLCPVVRPDILPDGFTSEKNAWFVRAIGYSDYFTTVSETSRRELIANFNVPQHRVRSIPLGVSAIYHRVAPEQAKRDVSETFGYDQPYVLYVGGIQHNKNIPMVLRTMARLVHGEHFQGKLVLAGDLNYPLDRFRAMVEREMLTRHVVLAGCFAPEDPRLATIYRGASLFLFPSFYEGWTSPPLEAMACSVPVIASSASSIPETVGDGGVLVAPNDEQGWYDAARHILEDREHREALIERGIARASEYPWSRAVASNIELYRDVLAGRLDHADDGPRSRSTEGISVPDQPVHG